MQNTVAFVDTETLGLDADHQPIWEVGLILPNGSECSWVIERTQRELALAHPIALEMMGDRYNEAVAEGSAVSERLFVQEFCGIVGSLHLGGAVVSFDEERLRRMAWDHDVAYGWHYHLVDVEALAVGFLAGRRAQVTAHDGPRVEWGDLKPPWSSDELSRTVGVDPDDFAPKHSALADARWAKAVYEAVMGK